MRPIGFLAPLALLVLGCGGTGAPGFDPVQNSSARAPAGRVAVRIAWPVSQSSRVIPGASLSIRIEVRQGAATLASTLLASPATSATLSEIPTGNVTVRATAYANAAGTGVALATADVPATVTEGTTTPVAVPLVSTVQTVTSSPASVTILLSILGWRQLTMTARDSGGNLVPVAASDWEFSSSAVLVAQVGSTGVVTGLIPGTATITIREKTSGKTATVPVTIVL